MFWAASLDVVMSSEKDLVQLSSAIWTVPVPTPIIVWIHIHLSSIDYSTITLCPYEFKFTGLYPSFVLVAMTD